MLVLGVLKQGLGCDFDRHDDASFRRQVRPGNSGPNQWYYHTAWLMRSGGKR